MARNAQPVGRLEPPAIARALLRLAADRLDAAPIIGDLHEEFNERRMSGVQSARNWYWRQTIKSFPHLISKRISGPRARRLSAALIAIAASFVILKYWDIFVSRNAARAVVDMSDQSSFGSARAMYFSVQMVGVMLAGALIAAVTFRPSEPFLKNLITRLAPAAAILTAPGLFAILTAGDSYPVAFRLMSVAAAVPSMIAGAACVYWLASKGPR